MNVRFNDEEYIAHTYLRFPIVLSKGKGSLVYDEDGKEYIDMATGIAVNTFGYCDEDWTEAVKAQLSLLQHSSNLYYTEPDVKLARLICERTGMKKVFFSNSGAEANECAIKAARKYAAQKKGSDYYTIITLKKSFHGRTITTLAATGQEVFHKDFLPLTEGFVYVEANDIGALEAAVKENKVAAIMFETVQGEGGVMPLEQAFCDKISELGRLYDIITIADEVQCGNGRSGALYAYMKRSMLPDIVTTAKGLGGGLPIGATIFGEKCADVFSYGDHGSTFGGNPVCCAGAYSILSRIDDNLLEEVEKKSNYTVSQLSSAEGIKSVSGMGLMLGLETEKPASEVIAKCAENGVLVIKAKEKVRLLPALNIPFELLKQAVEIIKSACR